MDAIKLCESRLVRVDGRVGELGRIFRFEIIIDLDEI